MYFILGRAFRLSLLGVFSAPIVFLFQLFALVLLWKKDPGPLPIPEMDHWLEMHAAMSLLAYGAFALTAIAGVMWLVQDRQLKNHHTGSLLYNLPPIRYLADALKRLIIIGLVLLTVGVVSAFFMEKSPSPLHLASFGAVWFLYAVLLVVHLVKHLPTRILSIASIVVFLIAVATLSIL